MAIRISDQILAGLANPGWAKGLQNIGMGMLQNSMNIQAEERAAARQQALLQKEKENQLMLNKAKRDYVQALKTEGAESEAALALEQQVLNRGGTLEELTTIASNVEKAKQAEQARLDKQRQRETLKAAALSMGLDKIADTIPTASDQQLQELSKEIYESRIKQAGFRNSTPAKRSMGRMAGLTEPEMDALNFDKLSIDQVSKLLSGYEAEPKFFMGPGGKPEVFRVNKKTGKVFDPANQRYVEPSSLGLSESPQLSRVENVNVTQDLKKEMVKMGAETYAGLYQTAKDATRTIRNAERAERLLAEGINSGQLANVNQFMQRAYIALGGDPANTNVAATEEFFASRAAEVATKIKAFGAGTGLSDKDLKFTESMVGADRTMTKEGIARIIYYDKILAQEEVRLYNEVTESLVEAGAIDGSMSILFDLTATAGAPDLAPPQLSPNALRYLNQ